mgnify:CR=1 FL=1
MCAKHVEHVEYGVGTCIPEMHTIVEQEDGTNVVTHYDVMFEDVLVQDIPVEELKVLEESHHGHMRKKKVKEEAPSKKQVRMAKGIAFDKRYKGGNMTGAAKAMEKIITRNGFDLYKSSLKIRVDLARCRRSMGPILDFPSPHFQCPSSEIGDLIEQLVTSQNDLVQPGLLDAHFRDVISTKTLDSAM